MCEPMTIMAVGAGLSTAGGLVGQKAQSDAVNAQNEWRVNQQNQINAENRARAKEDYNRYLEDLDRNYFLEQQKILDKGFQAYLEADKAKAMTKVSNENVQGASAKYSLADVFAQGARNQIKVQDAMKDLSNSRDSNADRAEAELEATLATNRHQTEFFKDPGPSLVGAALSLGGSALSIYGQYGSTAGPTGGGGGRQPFGYSGDV